jgi:hypothetical protein
MALKLNINLDKIKTDILKSQTKSKTFEKDTRFWTPTLDTEKNATVIMRFLPDPDMELWSKYYSHSFDYNVDGNKKWWIRNCLNTFGYDQNCPICKKNMEYWNSAFQSDKDIAGKRKRKETYVANVLIITNKNNPEDEGKVFLFKFGKKIFEKLKRHIVPTAQDLEDPDFVEFNPFHPLEGANFTLKVKPQGDYPNYDDSKCSIPKPLFAGDEKKITKVLGECISLAEFTDLKNYPTNEEVIQKLGNILGLGTPTVAADVEEDCPFVPDDIAEQKSTPVVDVSSDDAGDTAAEDDTDADLAFFRSLK